MPKQNLSAAQIIKDCAIRLFKEKGYSATSVNDICAAAEITKTTFYYHYKSKQELLDYSVFRPVLATGDTLCKILDADTYWQQLWALTELVLQNYIDVGKELVSEVIRINLSGNIGTFDMVGEEFFHLSEPIIRRGQANGQIRNCSTPKAIIAEFWKIQIGCVLLWCIQGDSFDLKQEVLSALETAFDVAPEYRIK